MKVGIIGAGLAGLMAGRALAEAGHDVVLWDKGRSPGGRLATRRIGAARLDHGAQFFTVRSDQYARHVAGWEADGIVREWCRGFGETADGHPRYAAPAGMNSIAKHLALGLDVRCPSLVFSIHRIDGPQRWQVRLDDATTTDVDALIVTCPLPQTFSLLMSAEVTMPEALWRTQYDTTLSLLAVLDRAGAVRPPGGIQTDPNFTFIGDNVAKGLSTVPALTLHAAPAWSDAHWDDDPTIAHDLLVELAHPYLGDATIVESQLKRWRFATPRTIWPDPCWSPDGDSSIVVAGDAFAGPRMEGAALSGLAAAAALAGTP
ncbi:MAG: NAD(P)-binding protein [Ilumatobacteraceae bacterium]